MYESHVEKKLFKKKLINQKYLFIKKSNNKNKFPLVQLCTEKSNTELENLQETVKLF